MGHRATNRLDPDAAHDASLMVLEEGHATVEEADRMGSLASAPSNGRPAKLRTLDLGLHAIEAVMCPHAAAGEVPDLELEELQRDGAKGGLVDHEADDDD